MIDAALALIAEQGPDGFTMREAARRAGVSSGAPYRHFPDRHALMVAVAREGDELLEQAMNAEMARAGDDSMAQFRAMGITFVKFAVANPSYFRVMSMAEYTDPDRDEAQRAHDEAVRSIIANSQTDGAMQLADPKIIQLAAYCLVYGLARMFNDGQLSREGIGPEQAEAIATAVTGIFGIGIMPRQGAPRAPDVSKLEDI